MSLKLYYLLYSVILILFNIYINYINRADVKIHNMDPIQIKRSITILSKPIQEMIWSDKLNNKLLRISPQNIGKDKLSLIPSNHFNPIKEIKYSFN